MPIRLIPNTSVQFVALPSISKNEVPSVKVLVRADGTPDRLATLAMPRDGAGTASGRSGWQGDFDDFDGEDGNASTATETTASANVLWQLLGQLSQFWIPIPMDAGGVWVAACLRRPLEEGDRERFVDVRLAVDTTTADHGNPEHGLVEGELGSRAPAYSSRRFWRQRYVRDWFADLIRRYEKRSGAVSGLSVAKVQEAVAAFAHHMRATGQLEIEMAALPREGRELDVDLVLDLGNSRTCALLWEHTALDPEGGLEDLLSLVYADDPFLIQKAPFDTHLAMVHHAIGPESASDTKPFRFLSPCKLGSAASDLLRRTPSDPKTMGLSSPKRYLWDDKEPVPWNWVRADGVDESQNPLPIRADLFKHIDSSRPLRESTMARVEHRDPRLAAAIWAIVEILEQGYRQVNSVEWRRADRAAPDWDKRRRLNSLVIMYPAGMHSAEIANYRGACERAVALWAAFQNDASSFAQGAVSEAGPDGVRPPKVRVVVDEGTAIQLCWLRGELIDRHDRALTDFFAALGRPRVALPAREDAAEAADSIERTDVLRVASLDIGGGTIDLSIIDYQRDPMRPDATALLTQRLFHDGINIAGDDIVLAVVQDIVVPAFVAALGVEAAVWSEFLAGRWSDDETNGLRARLVPGVWRPLAHACLSALEDAADPKHEVEIGVEDVAGMSWFDLANLETRIAGENRDVLKRCRIVVRPSDMRLAVRKSIGRTLKQCSLIIHEFDCDLMVVGGRPSANPAVRDAIRESMPVPPGQLIFLSDWAQGLSVGTGTAALDAKTAGVVGACRAFRAFMNYDSFQVRAMEAREPKQEFVHAYKSGGRFQVGTEGRVLHAVETEEGSPFVYSPQAGEARDTVFGTRRFSDQAAEVKPLYRIELKRRFRNRLRRDGLQQSTVDVRLRVEQSEAVQSQTEVGRELFLPAGGQPDVLRMECEGQIHLVKANGDRESVAADRAIQLVLRTLVDSDVHWMDSGVVAFGGHDG